MVRERLYPVLRGRPRTAADLAYQFIDFGPIVVRADSMFFTIRAGSESICRISPTDPGFWTSIHSSVQYSAGSSGNPSESSARVSDFQSTVRGSDARQNPPTAFARTGPQHIECNTESPRRVTRHRW